MTIPTASAAQRVYEWVRKKLEKGEFAQGERLVTRNLAKELGVSLNPVREALGKLASERLLKHVPGAGTFVHRPEPQEIRELYGLREALEAHAGVEAARYIGEAELTILEEICEWWKQVGERMAAEGLQRLPSADLEEWTAQNERFHRILVEAGRNRLLAKAVSEYRVLTTIFRQHRDFDLPVTPSVVDQVHQSHSALVAALRQRDGEAARRIMAELVQVGCQYVLEQIARSG